MIFQTKIVGFSSFVSKKSGKSFVKYCVEDPIATGFKGVNYHSGIANAEQIPDPAIGDIVSVSTDNFGRVIDIQKYVKGDPV